MNRLFFNKSHFLLPFISPKYNKTNLKPLFLYNTMRWHSTVTVETSSSNNNNCLRLVEDDYCCDFSSPFPKLVETTLEKLAKATINEFSNAHMMNNKTSAKFLSQWIHILKAKKVLEIGTFTGYSAIAMASALNEINSNNEDHHLYSLENDPAPLKLAEKHLKEAQLSDLVTLMEGDAKGSLLSLVELNLKFDLIFLDADKGGYINYFDIIIDNDLLADNGVLLVDNSLYFGQVHRESGYDEPQTIPPSANIIKTGRKVASFNKHVINDPRVHVVMLPLFDGISIIQKKKNN
ncbi:unnamed protein product [Cunninghamella blakesleeana]